MRISDWSSDVCSSDLGSVTEDEAKAWLNDRLNVPRETWARLELYVACLLEEMQHQNMIASSTRDHVWARHITNSARILLPSPEYEGVGWMVLGSGPGLPRTRVGKGKRVSDRVAVGGGE